MEGYMQSTSLIAQSEAPSRRRRSKRRPLRLLKRYCIAAVGSFGTGMVMNGTCQNPDTALCGLNAPHSVLVEFTPWLRINVSDDFAESTNARCFGQCTFEYKAPDDAPTVVIGVCARGQVEGAQFLKVISTKTSPACDKNLPK
ncbi:hypothetical protein BDU57DRAFT_529088 [Ampelomyces quisqualis]|uniref:Uncharacterized protein n=1 Tax=Ampelomyces quisqualis TaxID=50730 RepID=A0A6A5QN28_AMPQU|nr:hypothetical protein BDU57DRAFT_529088 [Ampelomyces quisqualis]